MGNVLNVSNFDELRTALSKAQGGDTISLASGNYGTGSLKAKGTFSLNFAEDVTIVSADSENRAVFTGLNVVGAKNLIFDGIVFDYNFTQGDKGWVNKFGFYDNQGLTVRNSVFDGDVAQGVSAEEDGFGYGIGVVVRGSSDVVFENNEMFEFWKGIKVVESENIVLRGNDIHSMRMDGINFAEVEGILIEDNHIHDFRRTTLSWDHADMIQSWTANTQKPSTDIVIQNNRLDIGKGDATQSIFMGNTLVDRGEAGEEMYFRNVTIKDNLIVNGQTNGISLGASAGVTISGNKVLHDDGSQPDGLDSAVEIPRISVSSLSSDVVVVGNVTAEVRADAQGRADWTVAGNVIVQDQDNTAENYYGNVFVTSSIGSRDFVALQGGMAGHLEVSANETLHVLFHTQIDPENTAARMFDAGHSLLGTAALPVDAVYTWDFGDGTIAQGRTVTHIFPDVGTYPVSLSISVPGHSPVQTSQTVTVKNPLLAHYSIGEALRLTADGFTAPAVSDDGIILGADPGPALTIQRGALSDFLITKNFSIDLDITLTADTSGTLFRMGRDINSWITQEGDIRVSIATESGNIFLRSKGIDLADGASHGIRLQLSDGKVQIWINDTLADSAAMQGSLANLGNHNFWLGTPWGASVSGVVESLSISANEDFFLPAAAADAGTQMHVLASASDAFIFAPPEVGADLFGNAPGGDVAEPIYGNILKFQMLCDAWHDAWDTVSPDSNPNSGAEDAQAHADMLPPLPSHETVDF